LRDIGITDSADEGAAACVIKWKDANEVFEAAGEAIGAIIGLGVGIAQVAIGREDDALAGLKSDAGVGPDIGAIENEFLGEKLLGGGGGGSTGLGRGLRGGLGSLLRCGRCWAASPPTSCAEKRGGKTRVRARNTKENREGNLACVAKGVLLVSWLLSHK